MQALRQGRVPIGVMGDCRLLNAGWQLASARPGQCAGPSDVSGLNWISAPTLGPVADVLRRAGTWSLDAPAVRFDAQDWWYRLHFDDAGLAGEVCVDLGFDGLATLCEVWLNGALILQSDNMFRAHRCEVASLLKAGDNELVIRCRSLDLALAQRRPRPRWRTPMVEHQQLRWFRTTLLGRTPGWSPPASVVGPWRAIWLAPRPAVEVGALSIQTSVIGETGFVQLTCELTGAGRSSLQSAELVLQRHGISWRAPLSCSGSWQATLEVAQVERWWPHTHGEPALYEAQLEIHLADHAAPVRVELGGIGFRTLRLDQTDGGFALLVNDVDVFCRGACWTPIDVVTLGASEARDYDAALRRLRDAGMNMVRVGGTMVYEADAFYDACDRLGILVWQDLMFANMDYPEDASFVNGVADEVRQQCLRWQGRPSLAVLCGNSEVEQQAAMSGATRDRWAPALFHETLARVCEQGLPAVPYWPSSAHGGAFPHQGTVGTTSYYGVGAYMRPLEDARRAGVRFATECLAFANVPEPGNLDRMHGGGLRVHHATWKARVPRDLGAGWDFDDVRDHYVASLFALDPARLRYADHERYLALARVAVGEVMAATFAEWRRPGSTCKGALVWFWRDLWAGAGWGLLDSEGRPKSAYYYLKRVLQPVSLSFSDEGGNGLYVHVGNEHPRALQAEIEVTAWRHGRTQVGQTRQTIEVPAHSARSWPLLGWFDWFADWSWVYRFGPASAQVLSAELRSDTGAVLARAFFFPTGMALPVEHDLGLKARARPVEPGLWTLEIETDRFAQAVYLDADGVVADDLHFHLAPGQRQATLLRATPGSKASVGLSGWVRALNSDASVAIEVLADEPEHQP